MRNRKQKEQPQRKRWLLPLVLLCAINCLVVCTAALASSVIQGGTGQAQENQPPPICPSQESRLSPASGEDTPILVNASHPLEEGSTPDLVDWGEGETIAREAYGPLQNMLRDMEAQGLSPVLCSGYRSYELQRQLYEEKVAACQAAGSASPWEEAARSVAAPGTSEHQLGLAVDLVSAAYQLLTEDQANTPEQQWLMANASTYGFILRYPQEKSHLTGIIYEPWHYRYVGIPLAQSLTAQGICLEEYFSSLPGASPSPFPSPSSPLNGSTSE